MGTDPSYGMNVLFGERSTVPVERAIPGVAGNYDSTPATVEYDLERAMEGIRASDLPDDFTGYLQTGGQPKPVEQAADAG